MENGRARLTVSRFLDSRPAKAGPLIKVLPIKINKN